MGAAELHAHLATGLTTVARCWALTRSDGLWLGFTDHDCDLDFDGLRFRAGTGLSAMALQQATGLSVDNTEALGALSDGALSEADVEAGRYDGAEVVCWLVNWADPAARRLLFRGSLGEIRRSGGAFHAELRGLTEALNRPLGRAYQKPCSAVLGDAACRMDLTEPGYVRDGVVLSAEDNRLFDLGPLAGAEEGWFARGRVQVMSGAAEGLVGSVKRDRVLDGRRVVELWEPLRAVVRAGDLLRLTAGCDKRFDTCRLKFNNLLNYQGFPDIPEEDWIMVHATQAPVSGGGSRR